MAERLADYAPRWLEEPVQPDRIDSYAAIRRQVSIPISGGEHEYTRWGLEQLRSAHHCGRRTRAARPGWRRIG
jgi:L-alanine-DL-glutamate epimerase-like enolase superfamily enzyme